MEAEKDDLKREKDSLSSTYTPNQRYVPGGSVDEHRDFEAGNIILTGDEIKQQNENLQGFSSLTINGYEMQKSIHLNSAKRGIQNGSNRPEKLEVW